MAKHPSLPPFLQDVDELVQAERGSPDIFETDITPELFSTERLERHGREVAERHAVTRRPTSNRLLERLEENAAIITGVHRILQEAIASRRFADVPLTATWLLDNYYLIDRQIRAEQRNLPRSYNRQLPQLSEGRSAGLPRVYDMALEVVAHGDGRVDSERLTRFVSGYQTVVPLGIGELWAFPIMLRLALVEKIRDIASRLALRIRDQFTAMAWAEYLVSAAERDPQNVIAALADMAGAAPPLTGAFVADFSRRFRGQGAGMAQPLTWMAQTLAASGREIDQTIQLETRRQACDQVSMGNAITSLRLLTTLDWRAFVESLSVAERVLRDDPAGCYAAMTFSSRDRYRHAVERLAKRFGMNEEDVARAAIDLARERNDRPEGCGDAAAANHVGHYLFSPGLHILEERLAPHSPGSRPSRWIRGLARSVSTAPLIPYLAFAAIFSALAALPFPLMARHSGLSWWATLALAVLAFLAASRFGLSLTNWLATLVFPPNVPPRMDFSDGIPPRARTAVVVPCLISSAEDVLHLLEGLEVRSLANREKVLHFGLLSDFTDAPSETLPGDGELLRLAKEGIDDLNAKYPNQPGDRFFLCHRPRVWNPAEGVWMGRERKRGKLEDFNSLLRGQGRERFLLLAGGLVEKGDSPEARETRYVITLDADTQLPSGAAGKLIGAMEHPMNHPVNDPKTGLVVAGHAILQPRMGTGLSPKGDSLYAGIFGGDIGLDPYTRTVSDIYQDLFDEGSFIGKGIYRVDAVQAAIGGRFPDNHILSHDLIEGCYARSGLLGDVQLYEEYPSRYGSDAKRRHRWARGDWQLLPWLMPRVPTGNGGTEKNPLSALSRWKIVDNLRRTWTPIAIFALLVVGWLASDYPITWTATAIALPFLPQFFVSARNTLRNGDGVSLQRRFHAVTNCLGLNALRAGLEFAWLPHEAAAMADAIVRTLWNMLATGRRMLTWEASLRNSRLADESLSARYRTMWPCPAAAAGLAALLWQSGVALAPAAPVLVLWSVSPWIAWRLGRPRARPDTALSEKDEKFLRGLARKTWAFFDQYVGPADNWLPPDNMQEQPVEAVAHRTSPTNMGLSLLAHLAAFDFGYLGAESVLGRIDKTLYTMSLLPRHRGHFFNWYDTRTLAPLPPRYISTVDSGNLAGHLLTLRAGLLEIPDAPVWDARIMEGMADTAGILNDALADAGEENNAWAEFRDSVHAALSTPPKTLSEASARMDDLCARLTVLVDAMSRHEDGEVRFWAKRLGDQCRAVATAYKQFVLPSRTELPALASPTWCDLAQLDANSFPEVDRPKVVELRLRAEKVVADAVRLAGTAEKIAEMDFSFLYDARRDLFSIGFNLETNRLDSSYYDLLASEARLAVYVAIAAGQIPRRSWFAMGRLLTGDSDEPVLFSWSGSMFEYLMPLLVMPHYHGTLLSEACRSAVSRQIRYGRQVDRPWGISESGYNSFDADLNYQYRAFGCPGLGLRRDLAEDGVVAPYATALALMVDAKAAATNLGRLVRHGAEGRFGMHEAIDYTPARLPRGEQRAVVRSYMSHHQGMAFLSMADALLEHPMRRRFWTEPRFRSVALLLQERVPKMIPESPHFGEAAHSDSESPAKQAAESSMCVFTNPNRKHPAVHLLSNGNYHVMVTDAGGGYSRYQNIAVTRWREDAIRDNWGMFCYVRDVKSGEFWSAAHQPAVRPVKGYETVFSDGRAEFRIRDHGCEVHSEIVVSPDDDSELRRVNVANRGYGRRTLELTTYAEVVLAPGADDALHPAFSNLFVETELAPDLQAILCRRRPRARGEQTLHMFHALAVHGMDPDSVSYETDRARFIGRTRDLVHPQAMDGGNDGLLSNSSGSVLDPIVSIRCRFTLLPGQRAVFDFTTGVGWTREECLRQVKKYRDRHFADRTLAFSWMHSQVQLRQLDASQADARLYEEMAASLIFTNPTLRAEPRVLSANRRSQSGLWSHGISGDLPIVLAKFGKNEGGDLLRRLVQAHSYWRQKGLPIDLVILSEEGEGYRRQIHDEVVALIPPGTEEKVIDKPGGIFVRFAGNMPTADRILLEATARMIVADDQGPLADQFSRRRIETPPQPAIKPRGRSGRMAERVVVQPRPKADRNLQLANPYGGFTASGKEYAIVLQPGDATPAPWSNVLANPEFGSVVSETGSAYTWSENAHEFRLTPWSNDPLTDANGEAFYIRDEDSGRYWSPSPSPCRGKGEYSTRHGFGYSVFEHQERGIASEVQVFVPVDSRLKVAIVKVRNDSGRRRRISLTGYVEWVLGDLRSKTAMHIVTGYDPLYGMAFAQNPYSMDFQNRVAFFAVGASPCRVTCDRSEFIGRNGNLATPAALGRTRLSGRMGAGLDPCAAIQIEFSLEKGKAQEAVFCLGSAADIPAAAGVVKRFRSPEAAHSALQAVQTHWRRTLGAVQVSTPDPAVDALANGWLLYQVIACRMWARSGYYQSGGAFGFRDQLQDGMAMLHALPEAVRSHILLSASRQFPEGDVQHWWHPPSNRGVRTRCSDDFLWLPLAVARYIRITGDAGILDEQVGYIEGQPLQDGEESRYYLPENSPFKETLYQHCVRAIERGLATGSHGLPLMGSGDWNDGMNKVGELGKGESVWLGFFLYFVLGEFMPLARSRGDADFAKLCETSANELRNNLERHGWDGKWYRRAYFDDGTPLGSADRDECRIDSIAQSWSVLSGAADDERARQAMQALAEHLVMRDPGLIRLLAPPFDKSNPDPGYIMGYAPGVRENGGQYTHAAVWAVMAFAALGEADRAWELLGLINPIRHGDGADTVEAYKVEPYVVTADVYAVHPHIGRGGWSWYTGSAGWMYRLIVESLLGLQVEGDALFIRPVIPTDWEGYTLHYRHRRTRYDIHIRNSSDRDAAGFITVDNVAVTGDSIPMIDDGKTHAVQVKLGKR